MISLGNITGLSWTDIGPFQIRIIALVMAAYQFLALLSGSEGVVFSVAMRVYTAFFIVFGLIYTLLAGFLGAYFHLQGAGWIIAGVLVLLCTHFAAEHAVRKYWEDWAAMIMALVFTLTAFPVLIWGYFWGYDPSGFIDYYTGPSALFAWSVTISGIALGFVVLKSIKWIYPYFALIYRSLAFGIACAVMVHPQLLGRVWQTSWNAQGSLEQRGYQVWDTIVHSGTEYGTSVLSFFAVGLALALYAAWVNRFRKGAFIFFQSLETAKEGFLTVSIFHYIGWGIAGAFSTLGRMLIVRRLPLAERPLFRRILLEGNCGPKALAYLQGDDSATAGEPAKTVGQHAV